MHWTQTRGVAWLRARNSVIGWVILAAPACASSVAPTPAGQPTRLAGNARATTARATSATSAKTPAPPKLADFPAYHVSNPKSEQACAAFAKTYCAWSLRCNAADTIAHFGTPTDCIEQTQLRCEIDLDAPDTGASLEKLAECAKAVPARSCKQWRRLEDLPLEACHPHGSRRPASPCFSGAQCVSGFCLPSVESTEDAPSESLGCGTCAPMVSFDDACFDPEVPRQAFGCPPNSACSRGTCIGPFAGEGEACGNGAWYTTCYGQNMTDVVTELHCPNTKHPTCIREKQCRVGCEPTKYCEAESQRCLPVPTSKPACIKATDVNCTHLASEPCGPDTYSCTWPAACIEGQCRAFGAERCDSAPANHHHHP